MSIRCAFGFHAWDNIRTTEQNIFMFLKHDRCNRCGRDQFYFANGSGTHDMTKEHYKDLMRSLGKSVGFDLR